MVADVTGGEEEGEGEEGGQKKVQSLEARKHQKVVEEEEGAVGRVESWMVGKAERVAEDKGWRKGGTWEVAVVVAGV